MKDSKNKLPPAMVTKIASFLGGDTRKRSNKQHKSKKIRLLKIKARKSLKINRK
jgi:hypothetical protein